MSASSKATLYRWRRRIANLRRRSWSDRWLWLQAYILLGLARLAIIALSLRRLARFFGRPQTESPYEAPAAHIEQSQRVGWAIASASRLTPWLSNCFPQAITAQVLLRRQGIASTLYLGAALTPPAAGASQKQLEAHAWLRCGNLIVTGGHEHHHFAKVAEFASQPRMRAVRAPGVTTTQSWRDPS